MIRAGFVQFAPEFGEVKANLEKMGRLIDSSHAELLVLPELAATGYEFKDAAEVARYAEPFGDGPTSVCLLYTSDAADE